MTSVKRKRAKVEILRPLIEPGVAALGAEVRARVLFGEKSHFAGGRISRKNLSVEAFHGEERGKIAAVWENPAFCGGSEEATLAVIGGDGLRIKGVDVGVVCVLRIDGEHCGEAMVSGDVPIDLGVNVSAFVHSDVVGIGKRRDTDEVVTEVERLEQEEFVAQDGAGESEMRCGTFDAVNLVIDPAEPGDGIFEKPFPFVGAAAGIDFDDPAAKAPIFGGERIGEDAHGFHGSGGKFERGLSGDRIGNAGIVDECADLIGLSTFDVDEAVGAANDAREKR